MRSFYKLGISDISRDNGSELSQLLIKKDLGNLNSHKI